MLFTKEKYRVTIYSSLGGFVGFLSLEIPLEEVINMPKWVWAVLLIVLFVGAFYLVWNWDELFGSGEADISIEDVPAEGAPVEGEDAPNDREAPVSEEAPVVEEAPVAEEAPVYVPPAEGSQIDSSPPYREVQPNWRMFGKFNSGSVYCSVGADRVYVYYFDEINNIDLVGQRRFATSEEAKQCLGGKG